MDKAAKAYADAADAAVYQKGVKIMGESALICPVSPHGGALLRSRYVSPPRRDRRGPIVRIGYGTYYAWHVHEMTNSNVNWTKPGSGPKYLERPIYAAMTGYATWMGKQIDTPSARRTIDNGT
jgi:hypothetical protein